MPTEAGVSRDQVAAVVLAAGASRRMGFPKALVRIGPTTFLERILTLYRRVLVPVWVVLGKDAPEIRSRLELAHVNTVVNPRPELGPLSSLLEALAFLANASAVVVHPVDHPLVDASTIETMVRHHRRAPASILIPRHRGVKGHPTLFPNRFFADLRRCPLDQEARSVVRSHPASTLLFEVEDPGVLANLNDPSDLTRWCGLGGSPALLSNTRPDSSSDSGARLGRSVDVDSESGG